MVSAENRRNAIGGFMKFKLDQKYFKITLYATGAVCFSILFYMLLKNISHFTGFTAKIVSLLLPFLYAFAFAYLLNPLLKKTESLLSFLLERRKKRPKLKRGLAIAVTYLLALLLLYIFIRILLPQLLISLRSLVMGIPDIVNNLTNQVNTLLADWNIPTDGIASRLDGFITSTGDLLNKSYEFLNKTLPLLYGLTAKIAGSVLDIILGVILSVYMLGSKEKFFAQINKFLFSCFGSERAKQIIHFGHYTNDTFTGFIIGKLIDSLIIGVFCFIGMRIFRFPYPLLISVIVGITNIIPYFGPFIGAIPSIIIILFVNPLQAVWFSVFILALQQFDGNILGPKILGNSTGLSSFWVVFAIIISGGLFGFLGMLVGVPLFAIIYAAVKYRVEKNLEEKALPVDTASYSKNAYEAITEGNAETPEETVEHPSDEKECDPNL